MTTREAQKLLNTKRKDSSILFNEEYKSDKDRHSFKCKKCSYVWKNTPNVLKRKDNIGCPNCHEISLQIKSERKVFSQVRGATKLLNSITLESYEIEVSIEKTNQLKEIKNNITKNEQPLESINNKIVELQKNHEIKLLELKQVMATRTEFGFIFGLLLFPIWIWYQFKFDAQISPCKDSENKAKKDFDSAAYELQNLKREIESLERRLKSETQSLEYEKSLLRLQNRMTIHFGGKTRLYYFRFRHDGKKYYKIGITVNTVDYRYRNKDGTSYRAIEKVFFDTFVKEAERIEQLIIHVFKDKLANDKDLLRVKGGYREVFDSDILGLDS